MIEIVIFIAEADHVTCVNLCFAVIEIFALGVKSFLETRVAYNRVTLPLLP